MGEKDYKPAELRLHLATKIFYILTVALLSANVILNYPLGVTLIQQRSNMGTIMDNTAKLSTTMGSRADNIGFLLDTYLDFNQTTVTNAMDKLGEMARLLGRPDVVDALDGFIKFGTVTSTEMVEAIEALVALLRQIQTSANRISAFIASGDPSK